MNILEKYNQEQLERFYKDLSKTEQSKLQKEIENIDFEQINSLYINSKKDEVIELKEIEPIKYYIKKKLSKSIIEEYSNLAKEILRKNKLCVITMAGGQGSRLGVNGPKGMFKLNIDGKLKSFFEINCEKLIKANKQYNIEILWLIMTSKENDLQTQEFFRNNNYFGYPKNRIIFFTQNEIPVLDLNGKILLEEKQKIKKAANGNGDVFEALSKNNIINKLDDEEIAEIAKKFGAKVPFMRSKETSNDFAGTDDVLLEVLEEYKKIGKEFDILCCLYSTAPFVTPQRLIEAFGKLNTTIDFVFTCVAYSYPIQRGLHIVNGKISMLWPEYVNARSQDLETSYHDAGQFYFARVASYLEEKNLWGKNTVGLILSELEVQDLDTITDWKLAEMKYNLLHP